MRPEDAWRATLGQLRVQLHQATFDTWVRDCQFVDYRPGIFTLSVRNAYIKDWLEKRLYRSMRHALSTIFREPIEIEFVVDRPIQPPLNSPVSQDEPFSIQVDSFAVIEPALPPHDPRLNSRYLFENFVVGDCNQMAHAAAQAISRLPGQNYNPLFVYGASGVGKTHLLHAVGHALHQQRHRVLYVTAEQFTNELVESIRRKTTSDFRETYRRLDALLLDDVQFFAGKENIQEELFHTFNALHSAGKQIVLASDRHPDEMTQLNERLHSRFVWGLVVHIDLPELATRIAILSDKAEMQGQYLPPDIACFIAETVEGNVRVLEGTLTKLLAHATLMGTGLTLDLAERILARVHTPRDQTAIKRRLSLSDVLQVTAQYYQLSLSDLVSKSRQRDVVVARQMAIYLARQETNASLPEIGDALGRNHSTVLYSYNKVVEQLETDPHFRQKIEQLRQRIHKAS
jgi:chromosomal replication initiator protein